MRQNLYCEFLENFNSFETCNNIFEDSSPKVFFRKSIRTFDFLRLSSNYRYSQSEPVKDAGTRRDMSQRNVAETKSCVGHTKAHVAATKITMCTHTQNVARLCRSSDTSPCEQTVHGYTSRKKYIFCNIMLISQENIHYVKR